MMELFNNYLFLFLNFIEEGRLKIFSLLSHTLKESGIVLSNHSSFENKLRNYNPLSIIFGLFIIFLVFKFILKMIKKFWNKFSI